MMTGFRLVVRFQRELPSTVQDAQGHRLYWFETVRHPTTQPPERSHMTEEQKYSITRQQVATGYVVFTCGSERPPPPEAMPLLLHKTVQKWIRQNSIVKVRAVLPIVEKGNTVAVHVWFD